jgi:MFS family permease
MMSEKPASPSIPRVWPFKRIYYGWAIVAAVFIAAFGQVPVYGPVLGVFIKPMQDELGWSRTTLSLGFTMGNLIGTLLTGVIGPLLDRYGARLIIVATGGVVAAAMVGMALMEQPWQFWALFGIGRGSALAGIQSGASVAIANWFIQKRGRAMAIQGLGLRVGQATFPLIIFAIMAVSSWRHAFGVLAGFTLLCIVVPAALFIRRRPEDMGLHPDGLTEDAAAAPEAGATRRVLREARRTGEASWTLAEARRTPTLWLVVLFTLAGFFCLGSVNLHMVASFQDKGIPDGLAVSVLSIFAATSALTVLPWGFLLEQVHVRYGAMLMCALDVLAMILISVATRYPMAVAFALVYGAAAGGWTVIQHLVFADYFGRAHLGAIRGFAAPFRLISPLGPIVAGYVHDATGSYNVAFAIFGSMFALMFLLIIFAVPPQKPSLPESA